MVNGLHNMRRSQEPTRTVLLRPSTCTLLVQWKFQWKEPRQGLGTSLLYTTEPFELHEHIDTICSLTGRTALPPLSESTRPCSRRSTCPPWASNSAKDLCWWDRWKDTCKDDGGIPLVCRSRKDPLTYVQAGWGHSGQLCPLCDRNHLQIKLPMCNCVLQ